MTVYNTTYATTSYEIVDTPFTYEGYQEEQYDPFLEVPYEWQTPRFKTMRSPLEQRMMLVPALAGLMVILLGIFAIPSIVSGSAGDTMASTAAAAGQAEQAPVTNEGETAVSPTYSGNISPVFSKEVKHWEPQIMGWAATIRPRPRHHRHHHANRILWRPQCCFWLRSARFVPGDALPF